MSIGARHYWAEETARGGMDMHRDECSIFIVQDNGDKTHAHTLIVIREVIKMLAGKDFYRGSNVPLYNPRKDSGNAATFCAVNLILSLSRRQIRDFESEIFARMPGSNCSLKIFPERTKH